MGAEDARAPMATCGYFNLNQAASTEKEGERMVLLRRKEANMANGSAIYLQWNTKDSINGYSINGNHF